LLKILGKTIWVPKIFFSTDWSYRNIKRIYFPTIYALYFLAAIVGILYGVPAIKDVFGELQIEVPLYFAVFFALMCLVGAVIPALKHLETVGSVLLLGVASMYLVTLAITVFTIDIHRFFPLVVTIAAISPLFARISLIGGELQKTKMGDTT
jgi:hypothetical protein